METKEQVFKTKRAGGPATILAIGTATPPNIVDQADYPDLYFRVTNSEHMTDLKEIFKQMCSNTMIKKRYGYMSEEILKQNPSLCSGTAPSLDIRQNMAVEEVPKLGKEAALKAIKEWGQPKSTITHLIFCTTTGVEMPGADLRLAKLLDLQQSINRFMFYYQGCYAGGTALRLAKDVAENNEGARVLVVCCEITSIFFHGPSEPHLGSMVGLSLFGDGAAALIVGANPKESCEKPLFELISAAQTTLPNTETAMALHLREVGHTLQLSKELPALISKNIEDVLADAFFPFGITDWNSIFWVVHPGGRAILDKIESKLGLQKQKLKATRHILSEYGNMTSATVLYILDEMRRRSIEEEKATTGEGLEWGVLLGFGAGLTIETVVLRSLPLYGQSSR